MIPVPYQAIEVDQSGKIETTQHTILAYSDGRRYAICIPSRVKRAMLAYLRRQGRSKPRAVIWLFAAGLFLLLHDVLQVSRVTIDLEYAGHEADIRSMVLRSVRSPTRIAGRSRGNHLCGCRQTIWRA